MRYLFALLIFVIFASSCGEWKDVQVTQIGQARIAKLDKDGIEAEIDVKINNPNKIGFAIFKSNVDVKMNGIAVGAAHLKKKVRIKANSEDTYTLVVAGSFDKLLSGGNIFGLISMSMSRVMDINLKGDIKAGKFFYKKRFPIDKTQRVPLQK